MAYLRTLEDVRKYLKEAGYTVTDPNERGEWRAHGWKYTVDMQITSANPQGILTARDRAKRHDVGLVFLAGEFPERSNDFSKKLNHSTGIYTIDALDITKAIPKHLTCGSGTYSAGKDVFEHRKCEQIYRARSYSGVDWGKPQLILLHHKGDELRWHYGYKAYVSRGTGSVTSLASLVFHSPKNRSRVGETLHEGGRLGKPLMNLYAGIIRDRFNLDIPRYVLMDAINNTEIILKGPALK